MPSDVRVQRLDLPSDRGIVGTCPIQAALSVSIVEMLQVPGRDPQLVGEASRRPRTRIRNARLIYLSMRCFESQASREQRNRRLESDRTQDPPSLTDLKRSLKW